MLYDTSTILLNWLSAQADTITFYAVNDSAAVNATTPYAVVNILAPRVERITLGENGFVRETGVLSIKLFAEAGQGHPSEIQTLFATVIDTTVPVDGGQPIHLEGVNLVTAPTADGSVYEYELLIDYHRKGSLVPFSTFDGGSLDSIADETIDGGGFDDIGGGVLDGGTY